MTGAFESEDDDEIAGLRRDYLNGAPEQLANLRKEVEAFRTGETDALEWLRQGFHRLAGSGGSHGFPGVSKIAQRMEQRILTPPAPVPDDADIFDAAIDELRDAFDHGGKDLGDMLPGGKAPGFSYRALVVMPPGDLRDGVVKAIVKADFEVGVHEDGVDPLDVPPSRRPDLVVIGVDNSDDALMLARYWAATVPVRPRAVVLADAEGKLDRLRSAAVGIDAVFGPGTLPGDLTLYARGLTRIGAPPANVMVVEDDPAQARLIDSWLRRLNARVTMCNTAQMATEKLAHEQPDLVLLDVTLPDVDGYAIARLMRQDPRLALVPIVFLTARSSLADEMEGLRAGGDDFLAKPVDPNHLQQVVMMRTERGRKIRELVHRDGLTGLLNHATLMAELEHAMAFSRRHHDPLCFLMLDLDHFKRINDTYGHLIGDQVLIHVATLFRNAIRSSDMIGRYGGEEFGVILRKCSPADGKNIADKLRRALNATPVRIRTGEEVAVRVSVGVAPYIGKPGASVTDLTDMADRALYIAKKSGRDRVEMAAE